MWVRRTSAEIAEIERVKQRRRLNPLGALVLTILLSFVTWLGLHDSAREFNFTSPGPLILFVAVFGFFYFSRIFFGRYRFILGDTPKFPESSRDPMICERCHTPQFDVESHVCSCGGDLELLDHWRWTDEDHPPPPITEHLTTR
jgi:hypothetical protein